MTVYAVRDSGGEDDRRIWTLSTDPLKPGWETDSGCDGYGLSKEVAEHYAKCINMVMRKYYVDAPKTRYMGDLD